MRQMLADKLRCGNAGFATALGDKDVVMKALRMLTEMKMLQCSFVNAHVHEDAAMQQIHECSQRQRRCNAFAGFADTCGDDDVVMWRCHC